MSILSRSHIRTHTGPYQTIPPNAPFGLLCLKELCKQEDSADPNSQSLQLVLARDFRDLENGSERSKPRQDVINTILSRRLRYCKYQTDISNCWCITNSDKSQTVLFEGIRFTVFLNDSEWVRVPLSGRLEVRPVIRNDKLSGEIVQRKLTMDLSSFWRRREFLRKIPASPQSIKSVPSPVRPRYAELDGREKLEAIPRVEVPGDVPPSYVKMQPDLNKQPLKIKEPSQAAAPVQQNMSLPLRPLVVPRSPGPRAQHDAVPPVPGKEAIPPDEPEDINRYNTQVRTDVSYAPYQREPRYHESPMV